MVRREDRINKEKGEGKEEKEGRKDERRSW